LNYHNKYQLQA